jgi:hypothetical protein
MESRLVLAIDQFDDATSVQVVFNVSQRKATYHFW